jgi:hypothetical protein
MRWLLTGFVILFAGAGCSSYTATQMRLVEQARKGVALWQARETAKDEDVKAAYAAKRKALDQAFDADIQQQQALTAEWVVEARKAYAVGLNALAQNEATALANNDAARRDAAATDEALARLLALLSIQFDVESFLPKGGAK